MRTRLGLVLIAVLLALPAVRADDWPQFRGPNRDDLSKEKGLLKEWPKDGPKLLWTYSEAGAGYSGFSIVGDRLYSLGADENKEYVFALDVAKGTRVWQTEIGDRLSNGYGDGPRSTPTVDGEFLYALGGKGNLVCLGRPGGQKKWTVMLTKDLNGGVPGWGYTESPLVDGDQVVCTPGGNKGAMAALDKKSGKVLWRSEKWQDPAGYSSIIPATCNGVRQYVQMTGKSVAGIAADDGRELWKQPHETKVAAVPTAIVKDNFVYVSSAYGTGCDLIKIIAEGTAFKPEEVYSKDIRQNMLNHHGGVVRVGDYVYGFSGGNDRQPDKWICQEFETGKIAWSEKKEKGSITFADDRLYLYGEKTGTVTLLEANPKEWKEAGQLTIPKKTSKRSERGGIWTHPVVANGRLYLRDQELIFCYDVKEK
jgi:hypothetical protein